MKFKSSLVAIAALLSSGVTHAEITIEVPESIALLVVNAEKPNVEGGFFSKTKTLTLPDGENQILFRYQPYFTQGSDRTIVESGPIVATFSAANAQLTFNMPSYRNAHDAKAQISDLTWQLTDSNGHALAVEQDKLIKEGMQIGRNFQLELAEYNRTSAPASLQITSTIEPTINVSPTTSVESTAEEMLHFWYNKADQETQDRFKAFINQ